jgi:hypothetical protein
MNSGERFSDCCYLEKPKLKALSLSGTPESASPGPGSSLMGGAAPVALLASERLGEL